MRSVLFQPPALVELEADVRPNASASRVKEARAVHPYLTLPYDPSKAAIALFLSEFLYRALREEAENRPLFAYLRSSLLWLDECRAGFANFHLVFLSRSLLTCVRRCYGWTSAVRALPTFTWSS